jgi:hypothetical protein
LPSLSARPSRLADAGAPCAFEDHAILDHFGAGSQMTTRKYKVGQPVEPTPVSLDDLSFIAYRRVSTAIVLPASNTPTLWRQGFVIDPRDLGGREKRRRDDVGEGLRPPVASGRAGCTPSTPTSEKGCKKVTDLRVIRSRMMASAAQTTSNSPSDAAVGPEISTPGYSRCPRHAPAERGTIFTRLSLNWVPSGMPAGGARLPTIQASVV